MTRVIIINKQNLFIFRLVQGKARNPEEFKDLVIPVKVQDPSIDVIDEVPIR